MSRYLRRSTSVAVISAILLAAVSIGGVYLNLVASHSIPFIVDTSESGSIMHHPHSLVLPHDEIELLIVFLRRPEREVGGDNSLPFRNSPVGVYVADGTHFRLAKEGLIGRSSSTALSFPRETDTSTIDNHYKHRDGYYYYGYRSVPEGLYWLEEDIWRDGDICWLLSDWIRRDGTIDLPEQQELIAVRVVRDENFQNPRIVPYSDVPPLRSIMKDECYLHPSITKFWSHRDSFGCLNLHKDNSDQYGEYDFDVLVRWLLELGYERNSGRIGLLLIEGTVSESDGVLPERIEFLWKTGEVGWRLLQGDLQR